LYVKGGKVGGNVLKCCGILILEDYNTFIIFETLKQIMTPKVPLTLKIMDFQHVALSKVVYIYVIEDMNA
jgi:hypothetical protein